MAKDPVEDSDPAKQERGSTKVALDSLVRFGKLDSPVPVDALPDDVALPARLPCPEVFESRLSQH